MRISDWSSDVCSSDLESRDREIEGAKLDPERGRRAITRAPALDALLAAKQSAAEEGARREHHHRGTQRCAPGEGHTRDASAREVALHRQIGKAAVRERVYQCV